MADRNFFELQQVRFAYGETEVLRGITVAFPPGRFYGIVGPNGCGKTTLLDLLIGSRRPLEGSVRLDGQEVSGCSRRTLAQRLALVPQDYGIRFAFTVEEIVLMGRHPYLPRFGSPGARDFQLVEEAMAEIGIVHLKARCINELSGGEQQRVVVARALAQQTPVLLLDEATSSLDIQYTLEIFQALRQRVRTRGHTVIAVMHNLNLAAAYCDEVLLMKGGRIVQAGPTAEVLNPAGIREVFNVESAVYFDEFSRSLQVSFRYGE
jgi:iron complex transport system ATP-binding protein